MTHLRKIMLEELQRRHYSEATTHYYIRPQLGGKHHPIIRFPKLGLVALGKIAFSEWVGVQPRAPHPLKSV